MRPNCSRPARAAGRQAGFTLVEMLVGMVLLALVVSLMPAALKLGLQAWNVRGVSERTERIGLALEVIEQRLAQAMPLFERGADGGIRVLFRGGARMLEFVGPADSGPSGPGVFRHRLAPVGISDDAAAGGGLSLDLQPYRPGEAPAPVSIEVIRHGVVGTDTTVSFRYFGSLSRGAPPAWHEAWTRADTLPELVEISALLRLGEGSHRRHIVVAPRINTRL